MFRLSKYEALKDINHVSNIIYIKTNTSDINEYQLLVNALLYAKKYSEHFYVAETKVELAKIALNNGRFFVGINFLKQALEMYVKLKNDKKIVNTKLLLSIEYQKKHQSKKIEKYFNDISLIKSNLDLSNYFNILGSISSDKRNYKEARNCFKKAIKYASNTKERLTPLSNISITHIIEKEYDKAKVILYKLCHEYEYIREILISTNMLAYNYTKMGKTLLAYKNYKTVYEMASNTDISETRFKNIAKKHLDRKKLKTMVDLEFVNTKKSK